VTSLTAYPTHLVRVADQATNGRVILRSMVRQADHPAAERARTAPPAAFLRSLVRVADQIGREAFR
jgi:hypothetical protein